MTGADDSIRFGTYWDKKFLKNKLQEGFTEFAVGYGEHDHWIPHNGTDHQIGKMSILYHPAGKIITYETCKRDDGIASSHYVCEGDYSPEEFQQRVKEFKVNLGSKQSLDELVKSLKE